jgi:hypothetical protein
VQTTALTIALMLLGTAALARERRLPGLLCLVLAAMIKAYPIALLAVLIAARPRALLARGLLALAIVLLLPFLMQHPGYVGAQYHAWLATGLSTRPAETLSYLDLRVLLRVFDVDLGAGEYLRMEFLAGLLVALAVVVPYYATRDKRVLLLQALGLTTLWMTVFGPATESQTYILAAPISAWMFLALFGGPEPIVWEPVRWLVILSYSLFGISQLAVCIPNQHVVRSWGVHSAAGLLLMVALVGQAWARRTRPRLAQIPAVAADTSAIEGG